MIDAFVGFLERTIAAMGPEAAENIVLSQENPKIEGNPPRYAVGLALLARHRGDAAGFRQHMERAAALLPDDPTVQRLLAEARQG